MINKDGGGGQFLDFMGGHSCYEGGHRAHGGIPPVPPTRENPVTNVYLGTLIQRQMILITYQEEGCIFLIQTIQPKNDVIRIL